MATPSLRKVYPLRDGQGALTGWTKWPNDQGHAPIEETAQEITDFEAGIEAKKRLPTPFEAVLLDELEALAPGAKARLLAARAPTTEGGSERGEDDGGPGV